MENQSELRFARQLKKGVMEMLVLELLSKGPDYGYPLLTKLAETPFRFAEGQGRNTLSDPYRLEKDGMLKAFWQTGEGRSTPKKIYKITEKGSEKLIRQKEIWRKFQEDIFFIQKKEAEL